MTLQFESPTAFLARDEFNQSAGVLTGKTLPVGGTWTFGAGDTDDFSVETAGKTAQRTAVSDTAARFEQAGTTNYTDIAVQADVKSNSAAVQNYLGVYCRWTDASNHLRFQFNPSHAEKQEVRLTKVVAGAETLLFQRSSIGLSVDVFNSLRLLVGSQGRVGAWVWVTGSGGWAAVYSGQDSVFATAGALATGKIGIVDRSGSSTAVTRNYDNFLAFVPTFDAAIFA